MTALMSRYAASRGLHVALVGGDDAGQHLGHLTEVLLQGEQLRGVRPALLEGPVALGPDQHLEPVHAHEQLLREGALRERLDAGVLLEPFGDVAGLVGRGPRAGEAPSACGILTQRVPLRRIASALAPEPRTGKRWKR